MKEILIDPDVVRIKQRLRAHLHELGYTKSNEGELCPPSCSKEAIRRLHGVQRQSILEREREFVDRNWPRLENHFAHGAKLDLKRISISLQAVESGTWQSDLFRLASLTWSVPVSKGFGRRLRFLVWDDYHGKIVGLIALADPVFNLRCRDQLIGWNVCDRRERLVHVMDAYTLGALPPYNFLLGGKLVASLLASKDVQSHFKSKYEKSVGIISAKHKAADLVAITTSSALGRSSVYNRLVLPGVASLKSIGFTQGFGHFHIPEPIFEEMRELLRRKHHKYADGNRFGNGPNWRMRIIREALKHSQISADILRHNVGREVFLCELASNTKRVLKGEDVSPMYIESGSAFEIGALALDRWILPRASRDESYKHWTPEDLNLRVAEPQECSSSNVAS